MKSTVAKSVEIVGGTRGVTTPRAKKAAEPMAVVSKRKAATLAGPYPGAVVLGLSSKGTDLVSAVERGLEFSRLEALGQVLDVSPYQIAATIHLPNSTFLRRKKEGRLQPDESDRLFRFSQIVAQAIGLFEGDAQAAGRWLNRPARALGGHTPMKYAESHVGAREVEALIGRLEEGVFS